MNNGFVARDWGLFDAALNRPLATIGGSDVYPTLWEKAAAFLDSVEGSHPFVDGNKRGNCSAGGFGGLAGCAACRVAGPGAGGGVFGACRGRVNPPMTS
ncbi:type II toxin-antitoxin system death-on-curing family toxin, partial [Propionibacterium freudenreichii]|uniref:type II toxin-antitoxin system death-on-curing family toxin n=1 Tax=Propionibacterium freudenreichii TaxID=1744 RepID=UPI003D74DD31